MVKAMRVLVVCLLLASTVLADLYLHAPRGCNDRLNEENADRQNDKRLFDSENNARGGYCWYVHSSFLIVYHIIHYVVYFFIYVWATFFRSIVSSVIFLYFIASNVTSNNLAFSFFFFFLISNLVM